VADERCAKYKKAVSPQGNGLFFYASRFLLGRREVEEVAEQEKKRDCRRVQDPPERF